MKAPELRRIRLQLGLNQTDFARKLGVARNSVTRWETGVYPVDETAARLARCLLREMKRAQGRRAE